MADKADKTTDPQRENTKVKALERAMGSPEQEAAGLAPVQRQEAATAPPPKPTVSVGTAKIGVEGQFHAGAADQIVGSSGKISAIKSLFGVQSTFNQIRAEEKAYMSEKNPEKKEQHRQKLIRLGETFLVEKAAEKDDKDPKLKARFQSVEHIVHRLRQEHVVLENLTDQVTTGAKIKTLFGGPESTFMQIEKAWQAYQAKAVQGVGSIPQAIALMSSGYQLLGLIKEWEARHGKESSKEVKDKKATLETIRSNMGSLDLSLHLTPAVELVARGITIAGFDPGKETLAAPSVQLTVLLGEAHQLQATATDVQLSRAGMTLRDVQVSLSGEIGLGEVLRIQGIRGSMSSVAEGVFDYALEGSLTLNTGSGHLADVHSGGKVGLLYHGETGQPEVQVSEGFVRFQLGDLISGEAEGLSYIDGHIQAAKAGLTIRYAGQELEGKVAGLDWQAGGLDWASASADYNGQLQIGSVLGVQNLSGTVQGKAANHAIEVEGDLNLSLAVPGVGSMETGGRVNLANSALNEPLTPTVREGHVQVTLTGGLHVDVQNIAYEGEQLKADKAAMVWQFDDHRIEGEVIQPALSATAMGWEEARFSYAKGISIGNLIRATNLKGTVAGPARQYALELDGDLALHAQLPQVADVTLAGKVHYEKPALAGAEYQVAVSEGQLDARVGEVIELSAGGLSYESAQLKAEKVSATLDVLGVKASGGATDLTISPKGVDWAMAEVKLDSPLRYEHLFELRALKGQMEGDAGNFAKRLEGEFQVTPSIPEVVRMDAKGKAAMVQSQTGAPWSLESLEGSLSADILQFIQLNAAEMHYADNKLTLPKVTMGLGNKAPALLNGFSLEGKQIEITKDTIDWASIKVSLGKTFAPVDALQVTLPDMEILGRKDQYDVLFEGGSAHVGLGPYLSAEGSASLRYYTGEQKLALLEAQAKLQGQSPKLPGAIPPFWPLDLSFDFSLIPIGIPAQASLGIYADGFAQATFAGEARYSAEKPGIWELSGTPGLNGELVFGLKAGAGVGSSLLAYLGLYLAAEAKAAGKGELNLQTQVRMAPQSYQLSLENSQANYALGADLTARLKGGIEYRFLYAFRGTLYEVMFKEWQVGHAETSGTLGLGSGAVARTGGSGAFSGDSSQLKDPAASGAMSSRTRASKEAMTQLNDALQTLGQAESGAALGGLSSTNDLVQDDQYQALLKKLQHSFDDSVGASVRAYEKHRQVYMQKVTPIEEKIKKYTGYLEEMDKLGVQELPALPGIFHTVRKRPVIEKKLATKRSELAQTSVFKARLDQAHQENTEMTGLFARLDEIMADAVQTARIKRYAARSLAVNKTLPPLPELTVDPDEA